MKKNITKGFYSVVMVCLSNHFKFHITLQPVNQKALINTNKVLKQTFILLICMLMITASCNRKYRGMSREDREKMKIVERFHKGQARGGCPADRARIAKEKEEEKLAKRSRQKAAKK
ncbi:MAG: hypothetical protein RJA07_153 [Bacteroidota bacterium]